MGGDNEGTDDKGDAAARVDDAIKRLNDSFYGTSPARYFEHRLNNLLVVASVDPRYAEALHVGLRLGERVWTVGEDELIVSDQSPEDLRTFITAESLVLHSHTVETLMHLYIGHAGRPVCPWLEISGLPMHQFFDQVRTLAEPDSWTAERRAVASEVFTGSPTWEKGRQATEEEWEEGLGRLCTWLCHLAGELDKNRPIYNATKHGFGANPSEAMLQFLDENLTPIVSHEGPSLEALLRTDWHANERHWSLTTRWYEPEAVWAETSIAIDLLDNIWQIGRLRYCDGPPVPVYVPGVNPKPRQVTHFTTPPLFTEQRPPKSARRQ